MVTSRRSRVMDKMMRILLSLFLALAVCGCGERNVIVGFGDVKLGERASAGYEIKKTDFMFFDYEGSRATTKSLRRYSVYYFRRFKTFFGDITVVPMKPDQEREAQSSIKYVVEILEEKYKACTTRHFGARERPVNPEFIASVVDEVLLQRTAEDTEWQRNLHMVFEATDKNRHIGVFVKDDVVASDYMTSSKKEERYEILVLVVAWDDDLMRLHEAEKKALAHKGL